MCLLNAISVLNILKLCLCSRSEFYGRKNKDSTVEVEAEIYCDECGHEHAIIVSNTFYSATCYFQEDPGKYINCGFPYYNRNELQELQWIIESNEHKEVFINNWILSKT